MRFYNANNQQEWTTCFRWFNTSNPFASNGDNISPNELSNNKTATKYLSDYRIDCLWERN